MKIFSRTSFDVSGVVKGEKILQKKKKKKSHHYVSVREDARDVAHRRCMKSFSVIMALVVVYRRGPCECVNAPRSSSTFTYTCVVLLDPCRRRRRRSHLLLLLYSTHEGRVIGGKASARATARAIIIITFFFFFFYQEVAAAAPPFFFFHSLAKLKNIPKGLENIKRNFYFESNHLLFYFYSSMVRLQL